MRDNYTLPHAPVDSPATRSVAVVPHATNPITDIPKSLYVGTGGNITMRGVDDSADQVWKNVPSGSYVPFRPQYVRASGTTAADILALY